MTARHRLVAAMIGLSALVYMERTAVSLTAPQMIHDLRISETEMGSVFSAFYLAYTACMFLGGRLADKWGPRKTLAGTAFGTGTCAALTAVCGTASILPIGAAFACLVAVRFSSGVCASPTYPASAKLSANWFPSFMLARVQALLFGATLLGMALLPIGLTPVIGRFGWQSAFYGLAACLVGVLIVWLLWVRDRPPGNTPNHEAGNSSSNSRVVLLNPRLLSFSVAYLAFCYWMYLLESWSFYYYKEVRKFSTAESAAYFSAMMVTAGVATPAAGWISDKLSIRFGRSNGRRVVPIVGISLSVALGYLGGSGLSPLITAAAFAASYGFINLCDPVFWTVTIESTTDHAGSACGLMNTFGNCAGILSPVITPFIAARLGWTAALYAGSVVALLALTPWLLPRALPVAAETSRLDAAPAVSSS